MSPSSEMYLDYLQTDSANEPPGRPALIPLKQVYAFEPVPGSAGRRQAYAHPRPAGQHAGPSTCAATPACSTPCSRASPRWPKPAGRPQASKDWSRLPGATAGAAAALSRAGHRLCADAVRGTQPAGRTTARRDRVTVTLAQSAGLCGHPLHHRWQCADRRVDRATPRRSSWACRRSCGRRPSSMARHWPTRPLRRIDSRLAAEPQRRGTGDVHRRH